MLISLMEKLPACIVDHHNNGLVIFCFFLLADCFVSTYQLGSIAIVLIYAI